MIPDTNRNPDNGFSLQNQGTNDVKKLITRLLSNWYWFIIAVVVAVGLAFAYIRYTPPIYEITATLMIGEGNSKSPMSALYGPGQGMFQETARDWTSIYNQVAILSSTPMVSRTLSELDFEVSYYSIGKVSETELYKNAPFQILWDKNHPQLVDNDFNLTIHPDKRITVSTEGENIRVHNYRLNQIEKAIPEYSFRAVLKPDSALKTDEFSFIVFLNENYKPNEPEHFKFRFNTNSSLVSKYRSSLIIGLPTDYSSILSLTVHDGNIAKGTEFLARLIDVYQDNNVEKKNKNAELTIHFIDSQLQNISDSLTISEGRLETFRSNNQMINFSAQSQQLLAQLNELDNQLIRHRAQNKYYTYLKEYIETNQDMETVIAPSSMGIDDPLLNSFIIQLNALINEKSSQTSIRPNSDHPTFVQLNTQIEIVKNSLRQSINNILAQSDIELENLNQRMNSLNAQIRRLPATERNFVNFERKYQIDSQTYTFLLQKLSEARIAQASNVPDGQMLESPHVSALVSPQKNRIYSLALLLGLIFPATFILLRDVFNTKIVAQDQISALTRYPVIGHVFYSDEKKAGRTPVMDKPNSHLGNSYVSIRTKLNLLAKAKEHPVISVTSSLPGEGKSFNAVNIASSIALTRKKIVLLDLDVRNSQIAEIFNLGKAKGIVNYIIGKASLEEITYETKLPRLKVIPAGPIPPNPSEMLSDDRLIELLEKLKKIYDVIIIDTPPIGFVADIFQLRELIDVNVIVVRHKYTPKQVFKLTLDEIGRYQMKGVGIIINSIPHGKGNYNIPDYGYGYGYGYGDGYGYGNGKKQKNSQREILTVDEQIESNGTL